MNAFRICLQNTQIKRSLHHIGGQRGTHHGSLRDSKKEPADTVRRLSAEYGALPHLFPYIAKGEIRFRSCIFGTQHLLELANFLLNRRMLYSYREENPCGRLARNRIVL